MLKKTFLMVIIVLIFMTGCSPYRYRGETFNSSADALKRQAEIQSDALKQIKPVRDPIGGKAMIAIPSENEIRKRLSSGGRVSEEVYSHIIMVLLSNYTFCADVIGKSQMFDSVAVSFHNGNPDSFATDKADYLVYADVDGWFIRRNKSSYLSPPITFKKYSNIKDPAQRMEAFVNELYEQALIIKNKK
jgi:hypothetical protein